MARIEGSQLLVAQQLLGLSSRQVAGLTDIDDGNVSYTVPLAPEMLRRSLSAVNSTGWFIGIMENDHAAADSEASTMDVYNPNSLGAGVAQGGYPSPVPEGFDVWILNATLQRITGASDLTGGVLRLRADANFGLGWGIDDVQAAVSDDTAPYLAHWDGFDSRAGGANPGGTETGTGRVSAIPINMRIRRGMLLVLSTTSAGSMNIHCSITCGLFPQGLGQDIIG